MELNYVCMYVFINFLYVLYYVEMTYQMFGLVGLHILKPPFLYVLGGK